MPVSFASMQSEPLRDASIFLSASIPNRLGGTVHSTHWRSLTRWSRSRAPA